ncbi:hypothetical protein NDU88_003711 [Pleurodeles waltl]|uniref:Tektin n=1 Tax=Pleurodeles waltl TaxID=8319 RepID=A0AAV7UE21_PLEWA|nr:hypothetical protein NDU88_003711 [Pleurodeles waltl]
MAARDKDQGQGDKCFYLSDQSSWTSNEGSDSETWEQEQAENDKVTTVRNKQKNRYTQPSPAMHSLIPRETKDLRWDYTNTQLEEGSAMDVHIEVQTSAVSVETIYQSIMAHQEKSKTESRRTQLACCKMQAQIRQVAKTCTEFATCIGEVETRISRLQDDVVSQRALWDSMEKKLEDAQWKLMDLEDRLRRTKTVLEQSPDKDMTSFKSTEVDTAVHHCNVATPEVPGNQSYIYSWALEEHARSDIYDL